MEIENGYMVLNCINPDIYIYIYIYIKQIKIIIPYSAIKINTNSTPKYSILNLKTNSDSSSTIINL